MERLTEWIDEGKAIPRMDLRNNGHEKCCQRLAEYEDLGLTPAQVWQIDKLYRDKCEELARYKEAMTEAHKKQQEDEKLYLDSGNHGWIPCSERLPEPEKIVLICQSYSWKNHEEGAMVTIGRLHCAKDRGGYTYWEWQHYRPDFKQGTLMDNGIICPGSEYVDAWMPLPERYW